MADSTSAVVRWSARSATVGTPRGRFSVLPGLDRLAFAALYLLSTIAACDDPQVRHRATAWSAAPSVRVAVDFDPFVAPSANDRSLRSLPVLGWTGKGMSGRRPVVKGLVEALRTLRVRSCLRPVGAGKECPAGPDAGPHGSSPNQQNALVMAPALFLGLPSRSVGSHRFAVALDADRLAAKPRSC